MSRSVSVSVDVDVDLENFDDEDLVEELQARGFIVSKFTAATPTAEAAYLAARPLLDTLPDRVREFLLDQAGRIS